MSHPDQVSASLADLYDKGFKAGREAGMREAHAIAEEVENGFIRDASCPTITGVPEKHYSACASGAGAAAVAILAEAEK